MSNASVINVRDIEYETVKIDTFHNDGQCAHAKYKGARTMRPTIDIVDSCVLGATHWASSPCASTSDALVADF